MQLELKGLHNNKLIAIREAMNIDKRIKCIMFEFIDDNNEYYRRKIKTSYNWIAYISRINVYEREEEHRQQRSEINRQILHPKRRANI